MKKRNLFWAGMAVLALTVGTTSCQGLLYNNRVGQEIRFSASMQNGAMTRTAYSGEKFKDEESDEESNKMKERIDWENGDQVKIYLFLDNAPDHFFEPGENYEIFKKAVSDYSVAYDSETGKDAYKSRGKLSAIGNTALRWVGIKDNVDIVDHWFYSVYPAKPKPKQSDPDFDFGWSVTPDQDNYSTATITFPDLSGQDGSMDYAYMAAVAGPYKTGKVLENQKNKAATVDLDYYPMVTTVYVTFVNNSKQTTIREITLTGSQPLVGGYSVKYPGGDGGVLVENSISNGQNSIALTDKAISEAIPFFLIPQEYDAQELSLTINGTNHPLRGADADPLTLLPFHKYNVTVTINENGEIDVTKLTDGMIELIKKCCPYEIKYNNNLITNMDNASIRAALLESEELRNAFLEFIKNATSLNSNGKEIGCSIVEGDFNIFRNLESVDLMLSNNVTANLSGTKVKHLTIQHGREITINNNPDLEDIKITNVNDDAIIDICKCPKVTEYIGDDTGTRAKYKFKDMKGLQSIKLKNASSIDIVNCEILEAIEIEQASNLEFFSMKDAPLFQRGEFKSVDKKVLVYLTNCSTKTNGGTLTFIGNGTAEKKEKENSDKLKVTFKNNSNSIVIEF